MKEPTESASIFHPAPGTMLPDDEHNRALIQNVHPSNWVNPDPSGRYNLVVIGAGTAGLVTAAIASALGARVALIERHLLGGDCLNVGCVPSKGIIRASRVWSEVRNADEFGITIPEQTKYDFGTVMSRMRRLRARISRVDSARRYKDMGVDVFIGNGQFSAPDTIEVDGKSLKFSKAAVCTGGRASAPSIPGLKEAGYLTNETIFTLTELPRRMAVIGAGPIGSEMAQAFARLGAQVYVFEQGDHILPKEDYDAARIVQEQMDDDGVCFVFRSQTIRIEVRNGEKVVHHEINGEAKEQVVDEILVAVGRAPNVTGLGLEKAGVAYDLRAGVTVNPMLQTTNRRIYAAGDVCFPFKFTHTADALAQIVIQNALFPHPLGLGVARTDSLIIPWCTYTDPEIAHVGSYERQARAQGIDVETFTFPLDEVDRAILDGEDKGFARVHVKKGTDKILGATLVAAHAGELINTFSLAMKAGVGLGTMTRTIHPYPTQAEVIKRVANAWRKTTLTEGKKNFLRRWFSWIR